MARVSGTGAPLVSVVWGGERVQASNALPAAGSLTSRWHHPSERHPHPHRHIAPHQRRCRLNEGGVRL